MTEQELFNLGRVIEHNDMTNKITAKMAVRLAKLERAAKVHIVEFLIISVALGGTLTWILELERRLNKVYIREEDPKNDDTIAK